MGTTDSGTEAVNKQETGREPSLRDGVVGGARCVHCGAIGTAWPIRFQDGGGLSVCAGCGGWIARDGSAESPCGVCAFPAASGVVEHARCQEEEGAIPPAGRTSEQELLSEAVEELLETMFESGRPDGLTEYVTGLTSSLVEGSVPDAKFVDLGEPVVAVLPGRQLVMSLGLLAALEDEAQLAFVIAREWELESSGWGYRRFRAASGTRRSWWQRLTRRSVDPLERALELSMFVGYGPAAERAADRGALAKVVHHDYDASAPLKALRRLESAAIAGRGARFLLAGERAEWLQSGARSLGCSDSTRLNREVYRRVVDGFRVFAG